MRISVVIPTFGDRPEYLRETIASVCAQDFAAAAYEVLVIDNHPLRRATALLDETPLPSSGCLRVVHEPRVGLHHARHQGARSARGEVVVYVDDDVLAPPHWLAALSAVFDEDTVSCAGGPAIAKWEGDVPDWYQQFDGGYLSLLDLGPARRDLQYPECVWGCNMAVRRSDLYAVGGFNPDGVGDRRAIWLRGDGECGLQEKLTQAGKRIVYEPDAWLYHRIPASRLTREYFYWRFFTQGIQESFVRLRRTPMRAGSMLMIPAYATYCTAQMLRFFLRSLTRSERREFSRALAWAYYGRTAHQLRVLLSPALRRHVQRRTFLDTADLPDAAPSLRLSCETTPAVGYK